MNLQRLKWTKNVRRIDDAWAYAEFKAGQLFKLAWKDDKGNASKPQKDDLILLRQKGYVTHLVKLLDYKPENETWAGDYSIYRIVETLWAINYDNPAPILKSDSLFDYFEIRNYQGGDVMELKTLHSFKKRWDGDGSLESFQKHVQAILNMN